MHSWYIGKLGGGVNASQSPLKDSLDQSQNLNLSKLLKRLYKELISFEIHPSYLKSWAISLKMTKISLTQGL